MRRATVTCHPVTLLAVGSNNIVGMVDTWNQSGHLESEWKQRTEWQTPGIRMEATNRMANTWIQSGHLESEWTPGIGMEATNRMLDTLKWKSQTNTGNRESEWTPGFGAEAADKKGLKIIQSYSVLHPLLHLHELHFLQMSVY